METGSFPISYLHSENPGIFQRSRMRPLLQISALLILAAVGTASYVYVRSTPKLKKKLENFKGTGIKLVDRKEKKSKEAGLKKLNINAALLEDFASRHDYNSEISFQVDMSIPSGNDRFFVYNMKKDSIETAGLVTHGYGSVSSKGLQFSNIPGSNATSIGRYKVGKSYMGRFGLAYKLHGLDKTNNKAFERFVVLHAHDCVPGREVPYSICESQGCPTVAPSFLLELKKHIESSKKPILLQIYQ